MRVTPLLAARITLAGSDGNFPFAAQNPFDSAKQLAMFQRFPDVRGGVFVTVQNPFALFAATANSTTACEFGVDRPNGDEPGMPINMVSGISLPALTSAGRGK